MPESRREFDEIFEHKLNQILEYNQRQDKMINDIHKVIHGNGNPENGLIVKTTRMHEKINAVCDTLKIHWALLASIGITTVGAVIKIAFF